MGGLGTLGEAPRRGFCGSVWKLDGGATDPRVWAFRGSCFVLRQECEVMVEAVVDPGNAVALAEVPS